MKNVTKINTVNYVCVLSMRDRAAATHLLPGSTFKVQLIDNFSHLLYNKPKDTKKGVTQIEKIQ